MKNEKDKVQELKDQRHLTVDGKFTIPDSTVNMDCQKRS